MSQTVCVRIEIEFRRVELEGLAGDKCAWSADTIVPAHRGAATHVGLMGRVRQVVWEGRAIARGRPRARERCWDARAVELARRRGAREADVDVVLADTV